jgi:rod shape-determining protein MreC
LGELQYGDIVVTSGENGNYIRDIPLGTISKITTVDYDSSLDIELFPVVDFSKLENLIVVDHKSSEEEGPLS